MVTAGLYLAALPWPPKISHSSEKAKGDVMKSLRCKLVVAVLTLLTTAALAQSGAQKSFDTMKTLAGSWEGAVTVDPPQLAMGNGTRMDVSLRVTSRGNALVHEMHEAGKADDPTKYDHPITTLYLDGDRLLLTH